VAYQLERTEPLNIALRRVVQEQIECAAKRFAAAADERIPIDVAVHDTRRAMKRVRAVLRLARSGVSSLEYRRVYGRVRDAGRMLAGVRDAAVVRAGVIEIAGRVGVADAAALADACADKAAPRGAALSVDPSAVGAVLCDIAALLDREFFVGCDAEVAAAGLRRTWRRARRLMPRKQSARAEAFHEWRKAVKFCRHQVELFSPAYPEMLEPLAKQLRELSGWLGRHHDLAVALNCLNAVAVEDSAFAESARSTAVRVQHQMKQAAAASLPLGKRLFALGARPFAAWILGCWTAWRESGNGQPPKMA